MAKSRLSLKTNALIGLMALWPLHKVSAASVSSGNNDENVDPLTFSGGDVNLFGSLVWLIISLAIVIVLIVVVIKWLSQRNRAWGANASLRSLGGIALGQNSSVQVIEIAGHMYIVGVGDSVTLIDKLDDPEQARAIREALELKVQNNWVNNPIEMLINKLRKKRTEDHDNHSVNEEWNSAASFQQLLNNQMNVRSDRKKQLEELLGDIKTNERLMDDEK